MARYEKTLDGVRQSEGSLKVPVRLNKEVAGFAVNRLQYAIAAESWRLVKDGVMSAEDADKVVSEGLGLRWAFLGPLEVMALNGDGTIATFEHIFDASERVFRNSGS